MSRLDELIAEHCPDGVEYMQLSEISDIFIGSFIKKTEQDKTYKYPVYNGGIEPTGYYYNHNSKKNSIAISARGANCGFVNFLLVDFWAGNSCYVLKDLPENVDPKYLFYYLKSNERRLFELRQTSGIPAINQEQLSKFIVSVPPLPVQKEIVRILDQYSATEQELETQLDAELEAREKQYAYYRDALLDFSPDKPRIGSKHSRLNKLIETLCPDGVEFRQLRCVFDIFNGYTPSKSNATYWEEGTIPWFRMEDIRNHGRILNDSIQHISPKAVKGELFPANSIIIATSATIGEHALITVDALTNQRFTCLSPKKEYKSRLIPKFIFYYGFILDKWCLNNVNVSSFASVDMEKFGNFKFPIPPLPVQEEIVRILDQFDTLVNDIKQGLPAEISARRKQYEYYRDKLLTFKEKQA